MSALVAQKVQKLVQGRTAGLPVVLACGPTRTVKQDIDFALEAHLEIKHTDVILMHVRFSIS